MTWLLIAAGLMVALAVAVFGLCLCVIAARADRMVESWRDNLEDDETDRLMGIDYRSPTWHDGYQTGHAEASAFEADGTYKRTRDAAQRPGP